MNFFEQQKKARSRTLVLGGLFALGVGGVIFVTNRCLHFAFLIGYGGYLSKRNPAWQYKPEDLPEMLQTSYILSAGFTIALIFGGVAWRAYTLRKGGSTVAELLGGKRVDADPSNDSERQLRNVVEEMAIASGTPAPAVYVLENELSINAFAAGHSIEDSAIAVSRGALDKLSREELQGVVGHEFSHILNGDSMINLRLLSMLNGLMMISTLGRFVVRGMGRSSGNKKGANLVGFFAGVGLLIIGSVGVFFGRLIQAAISRQREFLADASAIQFTRDPRSIGGALMKISRDDQGSLILHPRQEEVSHMFFAQSFVSKFFSLFNTHPSIEERLQAIDPRLLKEYAVPTVRPVVPPPVDAGAAMSAVSGFASVVSSVGNPDARQFERARKIHAGISGAVLVYARTPKSAPAVVYATLLDSNEAIRNTQLGILKESGDPNLLGAVLETVETLGKDRMGMRLPLVELAIPALKRLDTSDRAIMFDRLLKLIHADGKMSLYELSVYTLVKNTVETAPARANAVKVHHASHASVAIKTVLLLLAHAGARQTAQITSAYSAGLARVGILDQSPVSLQGLGLNQVSNALNQLRSMAPDLKKKMLEALAACAFIDQKVTPEEHELLRAVTAAMGCPLPPLGENA